MTRANRPDPAHQIVINRISEDTVLVVNNGRTMGFAPEALDELAHMWLDMALMPNTRRLTNFVETLPTRTPLHANTPRPPKATLEDLA